MKLLIVLLAGVSVSLAKPGYLSGHYGTYGILPQPVQDTPEVAAAKAAHFAAHAHARAATAAAAHSAPSGYVEHAYAAPVSSYGYSTATVHTGYGGHGGYGAYGAAPAAAYGLGYNSYHDAHVVLTPEGVPVDTPEVQVARAAHAAAHAAAKHQHIYG